MNIDPIAAAGFMATHARMVDRHRFELVLGRGDPTAALAAVNAYRNPDGGYGWGLEPDLRSASSQPGGALHAFEVFEDIGPATAPGAVPLCDWLESASLPDGGLPFALPLSDPAGCAPFWVDADPTVSSLQITAVVAAVAHRVARHDPAVAGHPWLAGATRYCFAAIEALEAEAPESGVLEAGALESGPHALALAFAVRFLDAAHAAHPEAAALLDHLASFIPDSGLLHVAGGEDDEMMRPLDFAPDPEGPARRCFGEEVVAAELTRLADQQRADGGWAVDFASYSPAAALEWRGHATVRAMSVLRANGLV